MVVKESIKLRDILWMKNHDMHLNMTFYPNKMQCFCELVQSNLEFQSG